MTDDVFAMSGFAGQVTGFDAAFMIAGGSRPVPD